MAFSWDLASRLFLGLGSALAILAGILLWAAPQAAIFPLALGGAFLLAALAMAYDSRR